MKTTIAAALFIGLFLATGCATTVSNDVVEAKPVFVHLNLGDARIAKVADGSHHISGITATMKEGDFLGKHFHSVLALFRKNGFIINADSSLDLETVGASFYYSSSGPNYNITLPEGYVALANDDLRQIMILKQNETFVASR